MGSLVLEIAHRLDPPEMATPLPMPSGRVALLVTSDVADDDVQKALATLDADTVVMLLAGQHRRAERIAERLAIEYGFAVEQVRPSTDGRHPADDLVRRAASVLIVTREKPVGRLLQLAERYAKPVSIMRR